MLKHLTLLAVPVAMFAGIAAMPTPADAQVGITVGPRGGVRIDDGRRDRIDDGRRDRDRGWRERRVRECETIERTRINRRGERVTVRERRCG